MAVRTIWKCDGCDQEVTAEVGLVDWKRITVNLGGFKGYPVSHVHNGERSYELCPDCQGHLAEQANPRRWARVGSPIAPATSPTPAQSGMNTETRE